MNNFFIVANNVKDVNLEKTKALAQFIELRGKRCEYTGIERVFEDENGKRYKITSRSTNLFRF